LVLQGESESSPKFQKYGTAFAILESDSQGRNKYTGSKIMKNIKKLFFGLIFAAFAIVSINSSAFAGDKVLTVEIPFDFYVKNEKLEAGKYEVKKNTESIFVLRSVETGKQILMTATISTANDNDKIERVVFNQYGDRYFLRSVFWHRTASGRDLGESKTERKIRKEAQDDSQLAKGAKAKTVSLSLSK
jgi:hypothetical protein